jgi:preprotein translocase subunit SecG
MMIVVLVIHVMLTIALIGVVLVQKSEGGGLGIGGGGGGMSGFMTGRSTANLLTRTTAILAAGFMTTSIVLAVLHAREHTGGGSILDAIPVTSAPVTGPAPADQPAPAPAAPAPTEQPASGVPLAK